MGDGIQPSPITFTKFNRSYGENMTAYLMCFDLRAVSELNNNIGQTLVEYALILLLIAIVVATSISDVTAALTTSFRQLLRHCHLRCMQRQACG